MTKHILGPKVRSTTIICVRHKGKVAVAGDGQVSVDDVVIKQNARKVRWLYGNKVLAGFAGSAADALALFDKFEVKLEQYQGNLQRAAVELAKDWRTDKILRQLQALLAVADHNTSLVISGNGDVLEPDDGLIGIGSGGGYALAAARALVAHTDLDAVTIARAALEIAADICVYTNRNIVVEEL